MTQKEKTKRWLEVIEEGLQLKQQINSIERNFLDNVDKNFNMNNIINKMKKSHQLPSRASEVTRALSMKATVGGESHKKTSKRRSLQYEPTMKVVARNAGSKVKVSDMEEDKENAFQPPRPSSHMHKFNSISKYDLKKRSSHKSLLTPIHEDTLDQTVISARCLPKNFLTPKGPGLLRKSNSKSRDKPRKVRHRLSEDFASMKAPVLKQNETVVKDGQMSSYLGDFVECDFSTRTPESMTCSKSSSESSDVSLGIAGCVGGMVVELSPLSTAKKTPRHKRPSSGKFHQSPASLCVEDDCNTDKTIKDISLISQIGRSSPHEQASSANLSGAFHSTFQYPLHSTFNDPLLSFDLSNVIPRGNQNNNPKTSDPATPRRAPSDGRSFQDEDTLTFSSDSSPGIDVDETLSSPSTSPCDSSFLSVCVDSWDLGSGNDHTALYDTRLSEPRMLKRQAGQAELYERRNPVGLSESDLCDVTQEDNASLMATRATLPDFGDLSDESTLNLSPRKKRRMGNLHRHSDIQIPGFTLIRFDQTNSPAAYPTPKSRHSQHRSSKPSQAVRRAAPVSHRAPRQSSRRSGSSSSSRDSVYSSGSSLALSTHAAATIRDNTGRPRRISHQVTASADNLSRDRKKALAKKMKHFSSSFQQPERSGALSIQTLGHF